MVLIIIGNPVEVKPGQVSATMNISDYIKLKTIKLTLCFITK